MRRSKGSLALCIERSGGVLHLVGAIVEGVERFASVELVIGGIEPAQEKPAASVRRHGAKDVLQDRPWCEVAVELKGGIEASPALFHGEQAALVFVFAKGGGWIGGRKCHGRRANLWRHTWEWFRGVYGVGR